MAKPEVDNQSAESENHGDRKTRSDPNALGPSMSLPYLETSPRFEDSNGFDQTWNEGQALNGRTYKKGSYPG